MTAPALFPASFGATASSATGVNLTPFQRTPILRDGGLFEIESTVTIPNGTTTGTIIGLVPFRAGAKVNYGASRLFVTDIDTGSTVTFQVGYIFDDNANNTNNQTAFVTSTTIPQAGGFITFAEVTGFQWIAPADGWVVATVAGGSTTASGTVSAEIALQYGSQPVYA